MVKRIEELLTKKEIIELWNSMLPNEREEWIMDINILGNVSHIEETSEYVAIPYAGEKIILPKNGKSRHFLKGEWRY